MTAPSDPARPPGRIDRRRRLELEMFERLGSDTELLRFLLDASADALWCWDLEDPGEIWFSPGFWTLLGYGGAPPESCGGGVETFLDPADLHTALANIELHSSAPNVPYDQMLRYRHRDGSTVWLRSRGRLLRDAEGNPSLMVGSHVDLTELVHSEGRTRSLLESFAGLLFVVDQDGVYVDAFTRSPWWNAGERKSYVGRHVSEFVPPEIAELATTTIARAFETGRMALVDYPFTTPDGVERHFEARVRPVGDPAFADRPVAICSVYDITERERTRQALERKNEELRGFAHVAAHDLRSPLQAVQQLVGFLTEDLDGAQVGPESVKHLGMIRERVSRMQVLLDGLLEYAHAADHVNPRRTRVGDVVDTVLGILPPPRVGLRIEVERDLPTLRTDPMLLQLIVQNLVGNAVEHHRGESGVVHIAARAVGAGIELRVVDDGPGISEADHARAFEMFSTLGRGSERKGVGLAIVRKSVEALGGRVRIESTEGGGATFVVDLPELKAAADPARSGGKAD